MRGIQIVLFFGMFVLKAAKVAEKDSEIPDDEAEKYDRKLSVFLKDVLENFRQDMIDAVPDSNIPSLDPLVLPDPQPIALHEGDKFVDMVNLKVYVRNLNVRGISKFHIQKLKVDVKKGFFNFSLSLPKLMTHGQYSLHGEILEMFPVYINGPFSFVINDVIIDGYSHLTLSKKGQFNIHMDDLYLDLTFKTMDMEFPNVLGNGKYSKWLRKVLTGTGQKLFKYFHLEAMREVSKELRQLINKELSQGTISQLLFFG